MKTSQKRHIKASVLVLSSLSALAVAQSIPPANVVVQKDLAVQGPVPANWSPTMTYQIDVKENLPTPPQGCTWKTPVYSPANGSGTVLSGDVLNVKVINELDCNPNLCKPTTLKLGPASIWKVPPADTTPRATINYNSVGVSSLWATPDQSVAPNTSVTQWTSSNGGPFNNEWVGRDAAAYADGTPWTSEIPFCMCPNSKATATAASLRADNSATLYFDTLTLPNTVADATPPLATSWYGNAGKSGSKTISTVPTSTHKLVMAVGDIAANNATGVVTGFTVQGTLELSNGYIGACK